MDKRTDNAARLRAERAWHTYTTRQPLQRAFDRGEKRAFMEGWIAAHHDLHHQLVHEVPA